MDEPIAGVELLTLQKIMGDDEKINKIMQKGRSIGHNQWTWAMENRDNKIESYRANKKD